jgi:hypothetical protein
VPYGAHSCRVVFSCTIISDTCIQFHFHAFIPQETVFRRLQIGQILGTSSFTGKLNGASSTTGGTLTGGGNLRGNSQGSASIQGIGSNSGQGGFGAAGTTVSGGNAVPTNLIGPTAVAAGTTVTLGGTSVLTAMGDFSGGFGNVVGGVANGKGTLALTSTAKGDGVTGVGTTDPVSSANKGDTFSGSQIVAFSPTGTAGGLASGLTMGNSGAGGTITASMGAFDSKGSTAGNFGNTGAGAFITNPSATGIPGFIIGGANSGPFSFP